MAGYRVIRYEDVPEYAQLRQDFLQAETAPLHPETEVDEMGKKYSFYPNLPTKKIRLLG